MKTKFLQIENKAAKLKLNEQVDKYSIEPLVQEIERVFGAKAAEAGLVSGDITNCIDNAADTLDIEIHSPGGSVMDGYVLYNAIRQMRERGVYVTAHIQLAASMASVIAMAADKIVMREGARMMIHEASAVTAGDADEHLNKAELLESISAEIAGVYSGRTGKDKEEMRALMKKETWMDGKQAVAMGFADESADAAFDKETKGMTGILSKLFPGNDEVAKLEAAIADADTLRADLSAAQSRIDELAPLAEVNAKLQSDVAELTAKLDESGKTIEANAERITELEKQAEDLDAKASIKAAELLAQQGHPQPVALVGDSGQTKTLTEQFEELKGAEATAFYQKHRKAILAEQRAESK
jgi:ATP-dependent protease ClpP protease subunit